MKRTPKTYLKKRTEQHSATGVLIATLITLLLTAACIVFEVLCLKYFKEGLIARNVGWWIGLACGVTISYCLATVIFAALGKNTAYRIFFSGYLIVLFFLILLYVLQSTGFFAIFQNPDKYQEYLESAGIWMPLLYIILQYLQVVILPIPGVVSTVAGVALFGPFRAMLCSLVGVILGSLTGFVIGRKIGYKAVAWMVGKEDLDKWLKKVKGKDNFILTAMFILPLFPDDMLCFVAGLSSMTWQYFVAMIVFARTIGIAATCYSFDLIPFNTWWGLLCWAIIVAAVVAAFALLYKYMDKINDWFNKKFRVSRSSRRKTSAASEEKKTSDDR